MKEFSDFLAVISTELVLKDLTAQLGMEPSECSHDIGSPRGQNGSWTVTIWRLESGATESASLDAHCQSLLTKAWAGNVLKSIRRHKIEAFINIAAFSTPSLAL